MINEFFLKLKINYKQKTIIPTSTFTTIQKTVKQEQMFKCLLHHLAPQSILFTIHPDQWQQRISEKYAITIFQAIFKAKKH
jgi:hypothetical protein